MTITVDLQPASYRFEAVAGDVLDITIPLVTEAGDAADISAYTPEADVVGVFSGTRTAFTAAKSGSSVRLTLTAAQTAALDELGRFDLRLVDGSTVVTPVAGLISVKPSTTDVS